MGTERRVAAIVELWNRRSEKRVVDEAPAKAQRAHRYLLAVPVVYRLRHEAIWSNGGIANISRSGLLLETDQPLRIGAELEVQVPLRYASFGTEAQMHCRCTVVRTQDHNGQFAAGARITAYALGKAELGAETI